MGYKIQKIYVGDKLVRPKGGDGIYYDFTTVSSIPSEISVWKGSVSVSSGLKITGTSTAITMNIGDILSKSSIRIEITGTRGGTSSSWAGFSGVGLTNRQGTGGSDYPGYQTYYLMKARAANASASDVNGIKYSGSSSGRTALSSVSTTSTVGDYALYFDVDLNTGLVTGGGTTPDTWSTNYTLSSSQLTQLKAMQYFFFWAYPANSTTDTLKTLKITIS